MDTTLLDMARVMAKRSTCSRSQVGAIIALDGRVLSSGYNGAVSGAKHCDHSCNCAYSDGYFTTHSDKCRTNGPCSDSVHAEANAVAFAAKHGVALAGATIYTTLSPCWNCSQLIINSGIVRVIIGKVYRDHGGPILLQNLGIPVTSAAGVPFSRLITTT
jgi:dCMP deaminase